MEILTNNHARAYFVKCGLTYQDVTKDHFKKLRASDMDGAYRTIVETLEKSQEDAELNAICDSCKDQNRISVNLDDL